MEHDHLIAMLNRLKLTAIRDQLDSLVDEAHRWSRRRLGDRLRVPVVVLLRLHVLSTDVRNRTLSAIKNWTPRLSGVTPRFSRSNLSR